LKRRAKSRKHFRFRVANVALHEVGHTFGLQHCTEDRCPMQDAEGSIVNTDTSNGFLGPQCQAELEDLAPLH
jgi:archaemetzincin